MELIEQLKNYQWFNNTAYDYLWAAVIFIGLLVILKLFQVFVLSRLRRLAEKTKTEFDDILIDIFRKIKPPFYLLVALYFGIKSIVLPDIANTIINISFIVVLVYEVIRALERLLDYFMGKYVHRLEEKGEESRETSLSMLRTLKLLVRIALWLIGLIMVLANLGVDITSLVASLGIGGIAVALAIQNILSDVFSSFSIYLDKPFVVGDFIQAGNDMGTVEKIGIKTTRLRTPQGEELIISNKELTSARVQNFRRMERRRHSFNIGVIYGTPTEKLKNIPGICQEMVGSVETTEFDRCNFVSFGDSSLNFELVFYVNSTDYAEFLNVVEKVNLAIYKKFEEQGIEFAYPTQTVFLEK
jgi:small-conductance mechanosensitive channel